MIINIKSKLTNFTIYKDIMNKNIKKLLIVRILRSLGQGILIVNFALYLKALHYNSMLIGILYAFISLFNAGGSLAVGLLSDKYKRKPFLIIYTIFLFFSTVILLFTTNYYFLLIASAFGSFGLSQMGGAGMFGPADIAWFSERIKARERGHILSLRNSLSAFGMSIGAMIAMLHPILAHIYHNNILSYRPFFIFIALISLITLPILMTIKEEYKTQNLKLFEEDKQISDTDEIKICKKENHNLKKLIFLNSINGIAIGLKGPLIAYWFALRFNVGVELIAPILSISFFLTGILSFFTGHLTKYMGLIKLSTISRSVGVIFLFLIPIMPIYGLAAIMYILHQIFNISSAGPRQAISISLVRNKRRGFATSLDAFSMQLPRSIGPYLVGFLLDTGYFALPFILAAGMQAIYVIYYRKLFKKYDFPDI
jgi:MFS family permease